MAQLLNYTKYHKINVADHCHLHCQHLQIQQQQQLEQQLLLIKQPQQQQQQRQKQTNKNQTQYENENNNKSYSQFINNNNNNNNEFIHYTKLQQHTANDQQLHFHASNKNFQQLTSVSSFSILKNRNPIINNSHNINKPLLLSSSVPPQKSSSILPPSATCSYSPAHKSTAHLFTTALSHFSATYHNLLSTYSSYSTCCVVTYNMFTAYAEAATLQLKRKTQFNKLLHVSGHPDVRRICYLILMAIFYWGVMIRAAVATNLDITQVPTSIRHENALHTTAMFHSNLTISDNALSSLEVYGEGSNTTQPLLATNRSLKPLPISLLPSDDTLNNFQQRLLLRREAANVPDFDDDDSNYHDDELDEYEMLINNKSGK